MIGIVIYFKKDDGSNDYRKMELVTDSECSADDAVAVQVVNAAGFDPVLGIRVDSVGGKTFGPVEPKEFQ